MKSISTMKIGKMFHTGNASQRKMDYVPKRRSGEAGEKPWEMPRQWPEEQDESSERLELKDELLRLAAIKNKDKDKTDLYSLCDSDGGTTVEGPLAGAHRGTFMSIDTMAPTQSFDDVSDLRSMFSDSQEQTPESREGMSEFVSQDTDISYQTAEVDEPADVNWNGMFRRWVTGKCIQFECF